MPLFADIKKAFTKITNMFQESGEPGSQLFSGYLTDEFNPDLQGKRGTAMYDKMRKNDAQIYAILQAIKLPLLAAKWYVEQAKGDEETDQELLKEQAKFIEHNLMEHLEWKEQLRLILTYLDFGYKYLEKVYGIDENGMVYWVKWGDRLQTAHEKWCDDQDVPGAMQTLPSVLYNNTKNYQPFMPMEKLLLFSYQKEGDNYDGISVLRTCYKHWWFKDTLYKIQGISAERYGVGVPWVKMGESNSNQDRADAENMAKNLRSNETSYAVTPKDWDFSILTPSSNPQSSAINDAINHHNRMITMNILAPFLDLGSGSAGSFALSKDQSTFFTMTLGAIAEDIKNVINKAIKELILINWADAKYFPRLEVTDIGSVDMQAFATALNTLLQAGLITADEDIQRYVRDSLKLPPLIEKTEEDLELEDLETELMTMEAELATEDKPEPPDNGQGDGQDIPAENIPMDNAPVDDTEELTDLLNNIILGAKGVPLDEETKKKISEALSKNKAQEAIDYAPETSTITDAKAKIEALRTVITAFKEKAKAIKNKKLKKAFNAKIKEQVAQIREEMATKREAMKVANQAIRDKKAVKRTERKQQKTESSMAADKKRISDLKANLAKAETAKEREAIQTKIDNINSKIDNKIADIEAVGLAEMLKLPKREVAFNKAITANEEIVESYYKDFDVKLNDTEKKIKTFLTNKVDKAGTKMVNGIEVINGTAKLYNEVKSGVNDIMTKFKNDVSGGVLSRKMMKDVAKNAVIASADLTDNKELANSLLIAEPQIRSFMAGHISNMDAVVFNEGRHVLEKMFDNVSQEVSVRLTKEQIDTIQFNRNVFYLSVTAHPRALFRGIVFEDAKKSGANHFKLIVPPKYTADVSPTGMTWGWLFLILTMQQWNEKTGIKDNINTVGGLGLHHNSYEYFYPCDEENLDFEIQLAKQQRKELLSSVK